MSGAYSNAPLFAFTILIEVNYYVVKELQNNKSCLAGRIYC